MWRPRLARFEPARVDLLGGTVHQAVEGRHQPGMGRSVRKSSPSWPRAMRPSTRAMAFPLADLDTVSQGAGAVGDADNFSAHIPRRVREFVILRTA